MKRRDFIALLAGAVTRPVTGRAQQTVPVVGFVFSGTARAPFVFRAPPVGLYIYRVELNGIHGRHRSGTSHPFAAEAD
jgi:hypothetical protein